MSVSLKDINRPILVLVVVANAALYYAFLFGLDAVALANLVTNYDDYIPGAILAVFVGVLNSQFGHLTKARLVFWRWHHPLPGSRAFSEIMETDGRIDPASLRAATDPLPSDPSEQNRLWFKWYREFQNEPSVSQVHREYLFTRDWTGLAFLLSLVLVPLAFLQMKPQQAVLLLAVMIVQFYLVRWAARNHGYRFVASVLACKSASI